MNPHDALNDEERYALLLTGYSDALRQGGDVDPSADVTLSVELRQRLERALKGLRRLRSKYNRVGSVSDDRCPSSLTLPARNSLPGDITGPSGPTDRWVGRFQLRRMLGHVGGGIVFLAFDPQLRREVALKVPRLESMLTPELKRRFLREGRAAAGLNHPHLVPIHEAGESNGLCYLVSTYYRGGNLAQWLVTRAEPASVRLAAELTAALADAVQYVHDHGILHRDIKPGNILLDADGVRPGGEPPFVPRLSDFGVAKLCAGQGESTHSGVVLGTASYMAPEQVEGRRQHIGPAVDVYGLGAVLYELLTGQPPFRGETDADTLRQVLNEEPHPPRSLRREVPRDLATICLKCLEKSPGRRYATAAKLAAELRRYLAHEPILARPPSRLERVGKWMRRRPVGTVLLGGGCLLALVLLWALLEWNALQRANDATAALASRNAEEQEEQLRREREQAQQERQRRRDLYVHNVALAWRFWQEGRLDEVAKEIEGYRPSGEGTDAASLRGFEWYYLWRLVHPRRRMIRHAQPLYCLAYSADGSTLATGHPDGAIRLWDTSSGRPRGELTGHRFAVRTVACSADGKWLASGAGGELFLWDLSAPRHPCIVSNSLGAVHAVAFSPDGASLASAGALGRGGELRMWNTASGAQRFAVTLKEASADSVAFALDGRTLAVGCSLGWLHQFDAATGTALEIKGSAGGGSAGSLAFAPTGIFASGSHEGSVRLWKGPPRGDAIHHYTHDAAVWGVALSPDGATVASLDRNGIVKVSDWNTPRQRFVFWLPRADGLGRAVAFSPDGRTLAVGLEDGRLALCDVPRTAESQSWLAHRNWIQPREAWAVAYSPDGRTLASAGDDHLVRLWDAATGQERRTLLGHTSLVTCLAYSPDGRLLASGSYDGTIRLWDAANGRQLASLPHPRRSLYRLAFSPDGALLASGGKDRRVRLWDVRSRRPVPLPQADRAAVITVVAFASDGRYLAAGDTGGVLTIWEMDNRRVVADLHPPGGPACSISHLAFSPDSQTLATVHYIDGSVRLTRVGTWKGLAAFGRRKAGASVAAYTPDGQTLVVGYMDGVIRLWHTATRRELLTIRGNRLRVNSLALSPDGRTLAAVRHDGRIHLWRGASDEEIRPIEQGREGR